MPVVASQIKWGGYNIYEGPYFPGVTPYQMPEAPDFEDKLLRTITATEGGAYDAINMYDSCILSVGIIQLCEKASLKVTGMLGRCAETEQSFIKDVFSQLPIPADFKRNARNQWRLIFLDGRGEVDTPDKMRLMYLGGSTGQKGGYSEEQKAHAREVAAAFASLWDNPQMRAAQIAHLKPTLTSYVLARSRTALWQDPSQDGLPGALKAAVVSYGANIPSTADRLFFEATQSSAWNGASDVDKFTIAMRSLVFGSKVGIWPGRYEKIQPVLEKLFDVDLPSLEDLAGPDDSVEGADDDLNTISGIQGFLIGHGFDLGPTGADGVIGNKTREAVVTFQCSKGLTPDGIVGPATRSAMLEVLRSEGKA